MSWFFKVCFFQIQLVPLRQGRHRAVLQGDAREPHHRGGFARAPLAGHGQEGGVGQGWIPLFHVYVILYTHKTRFNTVFHVSLFFAAVTKHGSIDDSRCGPCLTNLVTPPWE